MLPLKIVEIISEVILLISAHQKTLWLSISSRSLPQLKDHFFFFLLGCGPDPDGCSAHSGFCHEAAMKEHCPATCGQCKRGKTCYTTGYIRPL